jgi:hypothetical protein
MTIEQQAINETDKFNTWMRKTVQSSGYCSNEKMTEGYTRVYNNYIKLELAYGKCRTKK